MPTYRSNLDRIMTEQGRIGSWLAENLGVDRATVSRWRSGLPVSDDGKRSAIAELLGVEVDDLWPPAQAEAA